MSAGVENTRADGAENARARRLDLAKEQLRRVRDNGSSFRYEGRRQAKSSVKTFVLHAEFPAPPFPWTPHVQMLLGGARDEQSPLSLLRGHEETVMRHIYSYLVEWWKICVTHTLPAHNLGRFRDFRCESNNFEKDGDEYEFVFDHFRWPYGYKSVENVVVLNDGMLPLGPLISNRPKVAFTRCGRVDFPPARDRNVNMLPFIMGDPESLPEELQPYYDTVIARCPVQESEIGRVVYLTVCESYVEAGKSQRRGGLHIEVPASFKTKASFAAALEHCWGRGLAYSPDELKGGLFVASNLDNTTKVWNALVEETGSVDAHGGMEHLRPFLGKGYELAAGDLVWLTDKTPHEALPLEEAGYRQFFRLVTSVGG